MKGKKQPTIVKCSTLGDMLNDMSDKLAKQNEVATSKKTMSMEEIQKVLKDNPGLKAFVMVKKQDEK